MKPRVTKIGDVQTDYAEGVSSQEMYLPPDVDPETVRFVVEGVYWERVHMQPLGGGRWRFVFKKPPKGNT